MKLVTFAVPLLLSLLAQSVTAEIFPEDVLVIGGKGSTEVQVIELFGLTPQGNCSAIPDIQFEPLYSIGLRDNQGRAMVCGGSKNPNPKSCWILDRTLNQWIEGPKLKRKRIGASVTCLGSGVCWVFGGRSTSYTEYYDPGLNAFVIGPEMPVNSVHGLCTALGPLSNYIYMAAIRQPGYTRRWIFDPVDMDFDELDDPIDDDVRYPACAVAVYHADGDFEDFLVVNGGQGFDSGRSSGYYISIQAGNEGEVDPHPYQLFGSVAVPIREFETFIVIGGNLGDGSYPLYAYSYMPFDGEWTPQFGFRNPSVTLPVVVTVEHQDCPPSDNICMPSET